MQIPNLEHLAKHLACLSILLFKLVAPFHFHNLDKIFIMICSKLRKLLLFVNCNPSFHCGLLKTCLMHHHSVFQLTVTWSALWGLRVFRACLVFNVLWCWEHSDGTWLLEAIKVCITGIGFLWFTVSYLRKPFLGLSIVTLSLRLLAFCCRQHD